MSKVVVFGASVAETIWEPIYQEAVALGKKLVLHRVMRFGMGDTSV